jgi:catalase
VAYEPNSLGGGCPFQAGPAGFVSFPQPVFEDKVRGKPEKFADHYSQARLFWRSQSLVEKNHIIAAFRFELSRVTVGAVRRRMVSVLANVDAELAQAVATGLGLGDMPAPQPRALAREVNSEVDASPALSLLSRPGEMGAAGRRVAVLLTDGVDLKALLSVKQAFDDAGIIPRWVGVRLGKVSSSDGQQVEVETTLEAMPSALWDATVVLATHLTVSSSGGMGQFAEFLRDQYRHCKPILLMGWTAAQLADLGILATLPKNEEDTGLFLAAEAEALPLPDFIEALAQHRHFERETDPPKV